MLQVASELQQKRRVADADYIAGQTAALTTKGVVRGVARILARLVKG